MLISILPDLNELLLLLRHRISPVTASMAILAAGGVVIAFVGMMSVQRVSLDDEAERISGLQTPSLHQRLQMRLYQTGLRMRLFEFVLIGLLCGGVSGVLLILSGFASLGGLVILAGPVLYFRYLITRRNRAMRAFREQLPDTIYDFIQSIATTRNIAGSVQLMSERAPLALRPEFAQAHSLIGRQVPVAAALEAVGQARSEVFFRQFMDALAQNIVTGGNLKPILQRIAHAQRAQLRLHDKIASQQAGAKLVGRVYAAAPLVFLAFLRVIGGESYAAFYRTLYGQLAQIAIALSGLAAWWLTNRIAGRGLVIDDQSTAPHLNEQVHQTGFQKPLAKAQ